MPAVLHRNLPIVEVVDRILLDEILLDRQVSGAVLARLSDTIAVVDPERIDALVARLRKLGHLPTLVG